MTEQDRNEKDQAHDKPWNDNPMKDKHREWQEPIRGSFPNPDEFKSWYERNNKKVKIVVIGGVVYLLHKRALKKVVQKVVSREMNDLTFVMDYTSNPDYRGMAGEKAGVWRLFREI